MRAYFRHEYSPLSDADSDADAEAEDGEEEGQGDDPSSPQLGKKNSAWVQMDTRDDVIIKELRDKYGPRVGFYFAFLSSYTTANIPLALASLLVLLLGYILDSL